MGTWPVERKKRILSDPVSVYSKERPGAPDQTISALRQLWLKYRKLRQDERETQDYCRYCSKKIGIAKSNNEPVADLIDKMKGHSSDLAMIKKELLDLSNNILAYFETDLNSDDQNSASATAPARHGESTQPIPEQIVEVREMTDPDSWNAYIESNLAASIYHRAEWKTLIHNVFGHQGYYLCAHGNGGKILGVLPLIRMQSRFFGDFMVSMPYFNYGGAVADSASIESKLIDKANEAAKEMGVSHVEYRDDVERDGLPVKTNKVNMILSLPESHEELWAGFPSKLRSQIRRSQRESPIVEFGGKGKLKDFYRVFARNMRDLGTPVYGITFFDSILSSFPDNSRIVTVRIGRKPVAAAFLIGHGNTLEIPWASTIRQVNHMSINMYLYWEVLKFAIESEYGYFDFGRSSRESGTFRFKKQWGAQPKQLYWHYWLAEDTELPQLNPDNPKYALLINIWKRLPVRITRWLGPMIVKSIP